MIVLPRTPGNPCSELCSERLRQRTEPWVTRKKEFCVFVVLFIQQSTQVGYQVLGLQSQVRQGSPNGAHLPSGSGKNFFYRD